MKADRLREKEESSQMLDLLRSELESTRLAMSQQGLLLARLTSAPTAAPPGAASTSQPSASSASNVNPYSSYPPRDLPADGTACPASPASGLSVSQAAQTPLPTDAHDTSARLPTNSAPIDNPSTQDEPGSGSDGADAP